MLGTTVAEFYTSAAQPAEFATSDSSEWASDEDEQPEKNRRASFFEAGISDFTLIGSIFKTLGTPTLESWPVSSR